MRRQTFWTLNNGLEAYYGFDLTEEDAIKEMRSLLSDVDPRCNTLAEEVCQFCGDEFLLTILAGTDQAKLTVYPPDNSDTIQIKLGVTSDHVAESLVHELLHCKLLMNRFPYLLLGLPKGTTYETLRRYYNFFNIVCHELMMRPFTELGLQSQKFVAYTPPIAEEDLIANVNDSTADLPFWCLQWMGDWQNAKVIGDPSYLYWVDEPQQRVVHKYPQLRQTIEEIQSWLGRCDYHRPESFEEAFNELMSLIGMKPVASDQWVRLNRGVQRPIRVIHGTS